MNGKFLSWLKKGTTIPSRKSCPPSPFAQKFSKAIKILSLLFISAFAVWRSILYHQINSRLSQIRAAGLPTSGAELNNWRQPVPEAENGALVLTQAFSLARTFADPRSKEVLKPELLHRTNEWSAETRALVAEYVQTNSASIAKALEAFRLSRFRYPADFSYGPDTELPHLGHLMELSCIVALQSALAVAEGGADEWAEPTELLLKLATTLDDEPTLISHLTRNTIIRMAVRTTERSLSRFSPGEGVCEKLQEAFTAVGKTNLLPLALTGERATMIPLFRLSWSEMRSFNSGEEDEGQRRKRRRYSGRAHSRQDNEKNFSQIFCRFRFS